MVPATLIEEIEYALTIAQLTHHDVRPTGYPRVRKAPGTTRAARLMVKSAAPGESLGPEVSWRANNPAGVAAPPG